MIAAVGWGHSGIVRRALLMLTDSKRGWDARLEPSLLVAAIDVGVDQHDGELVSFALSRLDPSTAATSIDQGTLLAVLDTAARTKSKSLTLKAWDSVVSSSQVKGATPGPRLYAAVVAAHAACGETEAAFAALLGAYKDHPDMTTSPSAWMPLVRSCCGGPAALDDAYYILERLRNSGATVPVTALNVVVAACGLSGDIERVFETFDAFERTFGVRPDLETFHLLLSACSWNGLASSVAQVHAVMGQHSLKPSNVTTGHLIDADIGQRRFDAATSRVCEAHVADELPPRQTLNRLRLALKEECDSANLEKLSHALAAANVKLY